MFQLKIAALQLLMLNILLCAAIVASAPDKILKRQAVRKVTTTITITSTSLTTTTTPTSVVCAKFVNVTGACRRRKDFSLEEPLLMIFDEGLDNVRDSLSPTAKQG